MNEEPNELATNDGVRPARSGRRKPLFERIVDASGIDLTYTYEDEQLCGDFLSRAAIHLLTGQTGCGKTTLAFQLAKSLVCGQEFYGIPSRQVSILYVDMENGERGRAKKLSNIFPDQPIPERKIYFLSDLRHASSRELVYCCSRLNVRLVIFDTLRRCFEVRDENDNAEFYRNVIPYLDDLKAAGIASLVLTHPAKNGSPSARGAGAQEDSVDVVLHLAMHRGST